VFEWTHLNAAGERIPCEVRLVRLPDSERRLVRGSINDISERKRLEASVSGSTAAGACCSNPRGRASTASTRTGSCIFMNRSGEALIGYTAEEVLGRNIATS
jgi:PAS domain-containing protein